MCVAQGYYKEACQIPIPHTQSFFFFFILAETQERARRKPTQVKKEHKQEGKVTYPGFEPRAAR